jgi:hypothetical protein
MSAEENHRQQVESVQREDIWSANSKSMGAELPKPLEITSHCAMGTEW